MNARSRIKRRLLPLSTLLILALMAAGCSDDTTEPQGNPPDARVAADLSSPVRTPGRMAETIGDLELFESPMSSLAEDAGIYQETPDDVWTGEGVAYPQKSALAAAAFRAATGLARRTGELESAGGRRLKELALRPAEDAWSKAPGDTISVEYFDGPDSTGLNALIEADGPDMVRYVEQRAYPPVPLRATRRELAVLIDTGGTLENPEDDAVHAATVEVEMFGGEIATGTLAPVVGSGPIGPGVQVAATHHVEDPRFNPLQEWTEAVVILDPGEFATEGDELFYSLEGTVHWRSDAEHHALIAGPTGGPIQPGTAVLATGRFTAAPANGWLESVADTLRVRLGDLEDEADDLLLEASRGSVFDGAASDGGQPRSYVHVLPDEPVSPGEEPCGGEAYQEVWYPALWWLVHLVREADLECDGSGTLTEAMEFRNGTGYSRTITWTGGGAATCTETRPDGTVVSGSYDETTGAFDLETIFPAGHDPVSRHRRGTAVAGSVEAYDVIVWQDAHPDSAFFEATEIEGITTVSGYRVDGAVREEYTLSSDDEGALDGSWSRNDGASGTFEVERLEGGGAHLVFHAENPAEEGDPSVDGEIFYAPDGSGTGTIAFRQYGVTVTFDIVIDPDGTAHIAGGGGVEIPL